MARRSSLIKRSKRAEKKTRSETEILNAAFYGSAEPEFDPAVELDGSPLAAALTWYQSTQTNADTLGWLYEYHQERKAPKEFLRRVRAIPSEWTPRTAGFLARLALRGAKLPKRCVANVKKWTEEALVHADRSVQADAARAVKVAHRPSIQERMRDKVGEVVGELEGLIDDGVREVPLYEYLTKIQFPPNLAIRIAEKFRPIRNELDQVLFGQYDTADDLDAQLLEGYAKYPKQELEALHNAYSGMIDDATRYAANVKKLRAPRRAKPISVEKKLKRFRYLKTSGELRTASIDPAKFLGTRELWTYDPKTKLVSVFRADEHDTAGLDVAGIHVSGFNQHDSFSYGTGRKKAADVIDTVLKGTRASLRKFAAELKARPRPVTRSTERLLLLRCFS